MDLLNEVSVTLVVKAPNQKVADQTVECAPNWTVKKLKEHLALVHPSKPVNVKLVTENNLQNNVVINL